MQLHTPASPATIYDAFNFAIVSPDKKIAVNNSGFIISGKIRSDIISKEGLQCGDISQKVGYWGLVD
ncbi:MAG: hypothetical protein ACHQIM_04865 [Sphingobacteriales bacterium]